MHRPHYGSRGPSYRFNSERRRARIHRRRTRAGLGATGIGIVERALLGVIFASAIGAGAWRAHALTRSGALAAFLIGTCIFTSGGWQYAAVLFAFFIPSTLLSRFGRARKSQLVDVGKHGARDAAQVLANGGIAAVCALAAAFTHNAMLAAAFAGSLAAASADTWGTELGTLSKARPRSILTFRPVATGLSGGVTALGSAAEAAGAIVVAVVAQMAGVPLVAVAAGGICGALADSILGAWAQQLRYCERCDRACETDPHECGSPAPIVRGWRWMNNDAVNAFATFTGALAAMFLSRFFPSTG